MDSLGRDTLLVRDLLEDPFLKQHFPRGFDESVLTRQLRDPLLLTKELNDFIEMDLEEMATYSFMRGHEQEPPHQSDPELPAQAETGSPCVDASDPDAPQSRVAIQIEGMGLEAKIVLNKPVCGCPPPDEQDIRAALAACRVVRGIRFDFIERLSLTPVYGRRFKIAEGRLPVDGADGTAAFHFDTSLDLKPKIQEDGIADYKSLDYAKSVKKGELLCEIEPPTNGADGYSIFGEVLPGKRGTPVEVVSGPNTILSEDGRRITAACDGQVYLRGNKVTVSRVLVVDQVDASTGNILFVGTVQVKRDVADGFTIRAGGDIIVNGIVENAVLVSGGNIVLCSGMKGKESGLLDAGGNIRAYFIEHANIRVKGDLFADVLLNCTVECGGSVNLSGMNGCLIGGKCCAGYSVRALQIGNDTHVATEVRLKNIESLTSRHAELSLQCTQYQETVERLERLLDFICETESREPGYRIRLARTLIIKHRFQQAIQQLEKRMSHGRRIGQVHTVVVREHLYPNVMLEIDGAVHRNTSLKYACAAVKSRREIRFSAASRY